MCYEFTRNGRRYYVYPSDHATTSKIKVAEAEEFLNFIDDGTELYLLRPDVIEPATNSGLKSKGKIKKFARKVANFVSRITAWIKRSCPALLRKIGEPANLAPFTINTGDKEPINIRPRPYSPLDLAKIKDFLDENLKNGVIAESQSPWSAPIVLAKKPDGSTRVCVDYRALNRITEKDAHPLPRVDESFSQFAGAKYFTSLDLKSGYWQIPLDEDSKAKTAFSTRHGHFQWNVMPFGLTNAPAAFQRRVNRILGPFLDRFVVVYLDDILIFSRSRAEHEKHIQQVLEVLNDAQMILNLDKCQFFKPEVKFLGHILSKDGIKPDPSKIQKVLDWPPPRNITDVRGFINFAGFYRRYIQKFAKLALPLTDLMQGSPKKGSSVIWTSKEDDSFQKIKQALTSPPCLAHYDPGKPVYVDVDCSDKVIGGVLQQYVTDKDDKQRLHPIAFESKKLSPTEQRYSAQEREMLATKHCLNHWRHLVEGLSITIRSDHESLKGFRTQKHVTKRLARFIGEIEHFDPIFVYRPGKMQVAPDALSRMPGQREDGEPADSDNFIAVEDVDSLEGRKEQRKLRINDPERLKGVIDGVHDDLGHYGKSTTAATIKARYEVPPQPLKEAIKVLDGCVPCQLYKPQSPNVARIHPFEATDPFECWGLDYVGPLIRSKNGNEYLLTAVDLATSKAHAYPLPERSASAAIDALEELIWTYGLPKYILTDNGAEFRSDAFQAALSRYGIKNKRTTPGHPQTNGKVERLNHELVKRLQRMTTEDRENWDLYVRKALFAFHAHVNQRIGCSPFYLQYGIEPVLPSTSETLLEVPLTNVEQETAKLARQEYVQDLRKYRTEAADRYRMALERLASQRDEAPTEPILAGNLVMRNIPNPKSKLHPQWDGPFVVLDVSDKDTYQLATANGYIVKNLINGARIRKLTADERTKYQNEFWNASERLKLHDRRAEREQQLHEVNKRLKEATLENLQAQRQQRATSPPAATSDNPPPRDLQSGLERIARTAQEKRELEKAIKSAAEHVPTPRVPPEPPRGVLKRLRRLPARFRSD
jgi:transposase InsO family protein/uncharacterized protein (UPF0335 family)